jgi:hypothetical protein
LHSPFSGKPAEVEDEPNERDKTLLLVHYGDASQYAFISKRLLAAVKVKTPDDVAERAPAALLKSAAIPGTVAFVVDTGWNGINTYAWAPVESSGPM